MKVYISNDIVAVGSWCRLNHSVLSRWQILVSTKGGEAHTKGLINSEDKYPNRRLESPKCGRLCIGVDAEGDKE